MLQELITLNVFAFLLILARVGAVLAILPGIAASYVNVRFRVGLAVATSFVLTPVLASNLPGPPHDVMHLFVLLAGEIVIGLFLGALAMVMISALQTAGTLISLFSSMANALVQDPIADQQSAILASFLTAGGLAIVFATDAHHLYFQVIADSYSLFEPGKELAVGDMALMFARRVGEAFALGFQLSIPILLIAMIYYIGLGVLGRLMPQLPVFFFGLPIQITVQIGALAIVFSSIMLVFLKYFRETYVAFTG